MALLPKSSTICFLSSQQVICNYWIIVLDNGIKVLPASSIKPSSSNTCMNASNNEKSKDETICVAAGSCGELSLVTGLIHFLEHMVFMSVKNTLKGMDMTRGSNDTYTGDESTAFYFNVQPEQFTVLLIGSLNLLFHYYLQKMLLIVKLRQ